MASMRDIKRRKASIQNTQQITKAMKLVATAKLQKAKEQVAQTRPFFNKIYSTIVSIVATSNGINHPFLEKRDGTKNAYIVITSNRGLAGGYNSNICRQVITNEESDADDLIIAVGKRGRDILKKKGFRITNEYHDIVENPNYSDARAIGEEVVKLYQENVIDNVYIAYTKFTSSIMQDPMLIKVLPLEFEELQDKDEKNNKALMNYEPSEEEVLDHIVPKYVNSLIYGALRESVASEHGARMAAMDSATNNASEMIDDLTLLYNRARQASITQELSEIVGGAEALK